MCEDTPAEVKFLTGIILKMLEKKHGDIGSAKARAAVGKAAGTIGIICNFLLVVLKLIAGIAAGSVSIIGDAFNSISDVAASAMTLVGFRLAQKPADEHHPYGHARYEYLAGIVVTVFIFVVGVNLMRSSVEKILEPVSLEFSLVIFILLVLSAAIKIWMAIFYGSLGKKIGSTTLKAASADSRNDVITTLAVLVGCAAEFFFKISIDGWVGAAVAAFILYSGYTTARETISPLLGEADPDLALRIRQLVLSYDRVLGIHDLLIHDYGAGKCFASAHVELSAAVDPVVCHEIIDDIENKALEQMNVNLVIHYDPVSENDEEWCSVKAMVENIVGGISDRLSIHDLRITHDGEKAKLVFDMDVPYDMLNECGNFNWIIEEELLRRGVEYTTVISFDGKA